MKILIIALCTIFFLLAVQHSSAEEKESIHIEALNETSEGTIVAPVMNVCPTPGKNLVWCATYQAVWKTLQGVIGEDIRFRQSDSIVSYLNTSEEIREAIPNDDLKLLLVWNSDTLLKDVNGKIIKKDIPATNSGGDLLVYCFLKKEISFKYSYKKQKKRSLYFKNEDGSKCHTTFYGLRSRDSRKHMPLRRQIGILYGKGAHLNPGIGTQYEEFAVDLNANSTDDQIVLAFLPKENMTLIQLYEKVQDNISEMAKNGWKLGFCDIDILLFPEIEIGLLHQFKRLTGIGIANEMFRDVVVESWQKIDFKLDNKGAKLRSEAGMKTVSIRQAFLFDKPFLIYMKKRDVALPYFLMWVAHLK